jgi:hypothetical protein
VVGQVRRVACIETNQVDSAYVILQYGVYTERTASRIGYIHALWRRPTRLVPVLFQLRFFGGEARDRFFSQMHQLFVTFTELDETEREDMEGYAPYDADAGDRRSETWGVRNVHHEWSFCRVGGAALEGDESIDHETPFSGPVRPPAVRVYSRLIGES